MKRSKRGGKRREKSNTRLTLTLTESRSHSLFCLSGSESVVALEKRV